MDRIRELRKKIDQADAEILRLLNQRANFAREIGRIKQQQGMNFHAPEREREVIERLERENTGPFPQEGLRAVFREVLSACLALEQPLKVAYLGPKATFTHMACLQTFGVSAEYIPVYSIKEVFEEVERGRAQYGVVPVENSTEGVVNYTLDTFVDSDLKIASEVVLEVSHNLLSRADSLAEVKRVHSHPQAAAQCRAWLEGHLPTVPVQEVSSTARAAEMAAQEPTSAAIASEAAATLYNLPILQRCIEDNPHNVTRFLVISREHPGPTGRDKTSVLFSIRDRVGALYAMLNPFAERGINLTRLDARPSRKRMWDYVFYLDMEGHIEDPPVREAIEQLKGECLFVKILGSYPAYDLPDRLPEGQAGRHGR